MLDTYLSFVDEFLEQASHQSDEGIDRQGFPYF